MVRFKNVGMVDKDINRIVCAKSSKRNSEKGFTLVELIVVLVILAILAAAIVPALLGYTDHAKKKKYIATAEECLKASQAVLSDRYNDPSTNLTQAQRYAAAASADVNPEGTKFTIWTKDKLIDYTNPEGVTLADAVSSNIGAYSIEYALYETGLYDPANPDSSIKYVFYDGKDWELYDDLSDAEYALSQKGLVRDSNTKNIVYMWPHGDDTVYIADKTEEWKDGEGGGSVTKKVTFYLKHSGFEHGVVLKAGDVVSTKDSFEVTFTKNANTNPVSVQCSSLVEGSAITDEENNNFTLDVEDGFDDLLWSTQKAQRGTLTWNGEDDNSLLEEIFNNNVTAFYATTDKEVTTKTAIFKAFNTQTLNFKPDFSDQVEVTFNTYANEYDYGDYDATLGGIRDGDINGLSDDYGSLAGKLNTPTSFYNVGWAYTYPTPLANGNKYQMQQAPLDNQVYEYIDIDEVWKKVFDANEDNPVFTGIMIDGKKVNLIADDHTEFGPSSLAKLSLEVSRNELLGVEADVDTFGTYEANKIRVKEDGFRFVGFALAKDSDELLFYNDNIVAIKDYLMRNPVLELNLYAVTKDASQTLIKGAAGDSTNYPIQNVISKLSNDNKAKIVSFQRADYAASVEALTNAGIFDLYTSEDNGAIKGEIGVNSGRLSSGNHYAVFSGKNGIHRFAIVWDGKDDDYPVPTFAYSVNDGNGYYNVYWFSDDASPEVDGGLYQLFNGCTACNFAGSGLEDWNYSGCTSTKQMFRNCYNLTSNSVVFRSWDLSKVTTIANMFEGCNNDAFTEIDFSGVDMAKVTSMAEWLKGCGKISSIKFDNLNSPSLTNVTNYTYNKTALTSFSGRNWNAESVTSLEAMFQSCPNLKTVDLSGAIFSRATTAKNMFQGSAEETVYNSIEYISLEGADLGSVVNMEQMFQHQRELTYLNLKTSTPLRPTNCKKTFDQCWAITEIEGLEDIDTSQVTTMANMFYRCESLLDSSFLRGYDYSNVEDMTKMLMGTSFTSIDFSNVDGSPKQMPALKNVQYLFGGVGTDKVVYNSSVSYVSFKNCKMTANSISYLSTLFGYCPELKTIELTGWEIPNITNASNLFMNVPAEDIYLVNCNMGKVTNIQNMFTGCGSNTKFDLHANGWNMSGLINAASMFENSKLTSIELDGCDMSKVTSMQKMFKGSAKLASFNMTGWIIPKVQNMSSMLENTGITSINMGSQTMDEVTTMQYMFKGCTNLTEFNYTAWNIPKLTNMSEMFKGCTSLTTVRIKVTSDDMQNQKLDMSYMFDSCTSLTSMKFDDGFNIAKVLKFTNIIENCTSYTMDSLRETVSNWDLSKDIYITNHPASLFHNHKGGTGGYNSLFNMNGSRIGNCSADIQSYITNKQTVYLDTATPATFQPEPSVSDATKLEICVYENNRNGMESRLNYKRLDNHHE